VVVLETQGIFFKEKVSFGKVVGNVFLDVESTVAEVIVEEEMAIQVIDTMLGHMGKSSSQLLDPIIPLLVSKLKVDF
jgi:hypothetical protein